MSNILKLIISVAVCQLAGLIGTFFTIDSIPNWYRALNKPSFNPPDWLFGPVWIILYLIMGIALFMVWKEGLQNKLVKTAFTVFMIQLIFNAAWPVIFFGAHLIAGGLVVIIILWILILITIIKFKSISKIAALLLIPYLFWVSFATVLNFFLYKLN